MPLIEEAYLCAVWRGTSSATRLTEAAYLEAEHINLLVAGDTPGLIDEALARRRKTRRIVATVAHFGVAAALVKGGRMLLTAPAGLLKRMASEHALRLLRPPLDLPAFRTPGLSHSIGLGQAAHGRRRPGLVAGTHCARAAHAQGDMMRTNLLRTRGLSNPL